MRRDIRQLPELPRSSDLRCAEPHGVDVVVRDNDGLRVRNFFLAMSHAMISAGRK